ncbi:aldo/keto reductase [Microdochium trichocladiopsis]|uniref:Aldo/keto reductase n=1 Tax=Microdochium trichocladiopsis TaxID=1682393 RepID=A0A9P9BTE5_9PEZI|nr:aldo/keto reductase [Microdochium trichocladiopsis]KAH7035534.1 aldo/keto reductase [Microdochium trichocladiopsis]
MKFNCVASATLWLAAWAVAGPAQQHDETLSRPKPLKHIPTFGLGTWLSEKSKVSDAVEYALTHGYNHIDAALIYGNEREVGKGITRSKVHRSDIWVTSKLWNADHRPDRVHEAIGKTISDLGVRYLDLYLMHWPVAFVPGGSGTELDNKTSILTTWRAMEDAVRAGLTRHIGISNFARADVEALLKEAKIKPYAHEFETHPYLQQQHFVDFHSDNGIKVIAYSPLANTNPTYDGNKPVAPIFEDPIWRDMAERKNCTVAQAVLGWGLQRGTVVIPKSVHKEYIKENLNARRVDFTEEEMQEIAAADKKVRFNDPGKGWGVRLFADLDDPTRLDGDEEVSEL